MQLERVPLQEAWCTAGAHFRHGMACIYSETFAPGRCGAFCEMQMEPGNKRCYFKQA